MALARSGWPGAVSKWPRGHGSKWANEGEDRSGEPEVAKEVAVLNSLDAGTERVQRRTLP